MQREMPFLMILVVVFFSGGILFASFGYLAGWLKREQGYCLFLKDSAKIMFIFAGVAIALRFMQIAYVFFSNF